MSKSKSTPKSPSPRALQLRAARAQAQIDRQNELNKLLWPIHRLAVEAADTAKRASCIAGSIRLELGIAYSTAAKASDAAQAELERLDRQLAKVRGPVGAAAKQRVRDAALLRLHGPSNVA